MNTILDVLKPLAEGKVDEVQEKEGESSQASDVQSDVISPEIPPVSTAPEVPAPVMSPEISPQMPEVPASNISSYASRNVSLA